jgi:hypothetical protein
MRTSPSKCDKCEKSLKNIMRVVDRDEHEFCSMKCLLEYKDAEITRLKKKLSNYNKFSG